MIQRRQFTFASTTALLGLSALPSALRAQGLGKPATFVVGFPAGGSTDFVTRQVADRVAGKYTSPILVDNRAGAGARIAAEYVKARAPDGTSIFAGPTVAVTLYPHIYKALAYDPLQDLTPVTRMTAFPIAMFAGPGLPDSVRTLEQLRAWIQGDPKRAVFASPGSGASPHFAGDMIMRAIGIAATPVHYRGGAPAIQDLLGGQVALYVGAAGDAFTHVQSGKLRCLVTTGPKRSPFYPGVPTMLELGHKDVVVEDAFALFLPGKASPDVVRRLYQPVAEALRSKELIEAYARMAFEPAGEPPEQFAAILREQHEGWRKVVAASGFKPEE